MNVVFNIAEQILRPFITINAAKETPDLVHLAKTIDQLANHLTITGTQDKRQRPLSVYQISRFYTEDKHVVCETDDGVYRISERLYELKELLPEGLFVQVSSSELVAVASIRDFELTPTGSYQVNLTTGERTFASRRCMRQLREGLLK
ncbi:hypothetical protein AYR62_13855 [Secundilactobacillus paracollinoides]|uniref:HTH LytTR-type domain-containing protein n=1 Tax=Secundilactobacillus paracollinoides TaxID=240427 RepID=A0A1B2IWU5_9LACO|nr:LytTR family DNA-binding domain-containing protein [Secundilactobacillus paracollinoides]ANZ60682.1 hypothetical protein AYR61_04550 [Secundilactobacillus paracollinoides]ANZ65054.1 hypothetical protein AYR62_13855 [Secundilactobacillus paracollinoides]ANZ66525.1 hypothetical protein AYR63_04835 [Secundilactobacillus paracollinoides]KRL77275.1 hypothetical protein FC17_GL001351 [Secundilactobacillus paracollinoides DSM 15502 = JCM 11969]